MQEVTRLEAALSKAIGTAARERETLTRQLEESQVALNAAREEISTLTERTRRQEGRIEGLTADIACARADTDILRQQSAEQAGRFERELKQAHDKAEDLSRSLDAERQTRQSTENLATDLKTENARLRERAGYVDELCLQDRLAAPANQNQPEDSARTWTRKKSSQSVE